VPTSTANTKLPITPQALIATDSAAVAATQSFHATSSCSQRLNTADHTRSEITSVVPESENFKHQTPPWNPDNYTVWHSLVAKSQESTEYHCFTIPSFLYDDLMTYFSARMPGGFASIVVGRHHRDTDFDQIQEKASSCLGWVTEMVRSPRSNISKDSPLGGTVPSSTLHDIVTKTCSSMRAYGCL
jgi:hypothetical protein